MSEQAPAIAGIAALAVDCHNPPGCLLRPRP